MFGLQEVGYAMDDRELIREMVDHYTNLQRIKNADDPQKEISNQMKALEVKLQAFGIATEDIQFD